MTHIQKDHQIEVHNEQCHFANLQELLHGKKKEDRSKSYFVQHSSSRVYGAMKSWHVQT